MARWRTKWTGPLKIEINGRICLCIKALCCRAAIGPIHRPAPRPHAKPPEETRPTAAQNTCMYNVQLPANTRSLLHYLAL